MVFLFYQLSSWASIIYLLLGFYVLKANRKAKLNFLFWLWTLVMAEYALCSAFGYLATDPQLFQLWDKLSDIGSIIENGLLFHILYVLMHPDIRLKKRWLAGIYVPAVLIIVFKWYGTESGARFTPPLWVTADFWDNLYSYGFSVTSLFLAWRWGKNATLRREKRQARIFVVSGLITFILCLCNDFSLPGSPFHSVPPMTQIIILILAFAIWYALLKYKMPGLVNLIKIEDVIDKVTDLVFLLDDKGRIVDCNQRVTEKLAFTSQDLRGCPFPQIVAGTCDQILQQFQSYDGNRIETEIQCLAKSGESVPLYLQASPIREETGDQMGTLLVCQDKTLIEQLKAEIATRIQKEEQLRYLSFHDPVTGLFNRTRFEQELKNCSSQPLISPGIIICDIDGLKLVNDTLGHNTGDQLLIAAARALQNAFQHDEIVARIGGDEFAVLVPEGNEIEIKQARLTIQRYVGLYNQENPNLHLSLSIGYAVASQDFPNVVDLFKEADNYMYKEKLNHVQSARNGIIQALMKTLEARDFITEGHTERIQEMLIQLGTYLHLPEAVITNLRLLGQFHDIGKVGIPDRILFKPGALTASEMKIMRQHSEIGYRIAKSIPDLIPIADLIQRHHERWDGNGYPLGLQGEKIPLECRILAVIDAFDSMTNHRPYRKALPRDEAVAELERNSGIQFDPAIVTHFLELLNESAPLMAEIT